MPQLDHVSFFSQYLWLCISFFIFYIALLKGFLPRMNRILKLRDAKTDSSSYGIFSKDEKVSVDTSYQSILNKGLTTCQISIVSRFEKTGEWLDNEQAKTNKAVFNNANQAYLNTLGSTSLCNQLILSQLEVLTPPMPSSSIEGAKKDLYISRLIKTLQRLSK